MSWFRASPRVSVALASWRCTIVMAAFVASALGAAQARSASHPKQPRLPRVQRANVSCATQPHPVQIVPRRDRLSTWDGSPRETAPFNRSVRTVRGRELFLKSFTPSDGLGPEFNASSCASCHNTPGPGGSGGDDAPVNWIYQGAYDALGAAGARFRLDASGKVITVAQVANVCRRPPALFGIGALEAIPDDEVRRRSDPFDADADGISGRLPLRRGCVGRLGWQNTTCDIESFVIWALSEELGILTAPNRRREISENDVAALVTYVRQLPPPTSVGSSAGDELFERVLCSSCHVPVTGVARTGGTAMPVRAYTDLLLHEMGTGPRAGERDSRTEFRTPVGSHVNPLTVSHV